MKILKRKTLAALLALSLLASLLPLGAQPALAATQHNHNGWRELSGALNPNQASGNDFGFVGTTYVLTDDVYLGETSAGATARLVFNDNATLCLNGHTLNLYNSNGGFNGSIVIAEGANVTICDCSANPGKIVNYNAFTVSNGASLTLSDVTVDGSQIGNGALDRALLLENNASLTINSGTITGAETGISAGGCAVTMNGGTVYGAVYVTGNMLSGRSQFTLTDGTINGHVWLSNMDGYGTGMEMSGGTITGGNAENGGGIFVSNGSTCTISGGTVTNNEATNGGGIYVDGGGALTVQSDAQITSNNATSGGGVYVASGGSCTIDGGAITQNTATSGGASMWSAATPAPLAAARSPIIPPRGMVGACILPKAPLAV